MYIHVKVIPKSRQESFEKLKPLHFKALVKEPAERNLANIKVKELIAKHFGIDPKAVRHISGHNSPSKLFSIPE